MSSRSIDACEAEIASLRAENDRLRRRLEQQEREIGVDLAARRKAEKDLHASQHLLQALVDHTPSLIFAKDTDGRCILTNRQLDAFFGVERGALLGTMDEDVLPAEVAHAIRAVERRVIQEKAPLQFEEEIPRPEGIHTFLTNKFPILDSQGDVMAIGAVSTDITAQKTAEMTRATLQAQVIKTQKAIIRQLVTPLLPIANGIVAMPLVGTIDSDRAQSMIDALLSGVASHQAAVAILDITGVKLIDETVAQTLVQAAQAARLLGAQVVLTGIAPDVAQVLVRLGADLSRIVTQSTLQSGIAYALQRRPKTVRERGGRGSPSLPPDM